MERAAQLSCFYGFPKDCYKISGILLLTVQDHFQFLFWIYHLWIIRICAFRVTALWSNPHKHLILTKYVRLARMSWWEESPLSDSGENWLLSLPRTAGVTREVGRVYIAVWESVSVKIPLPTRCAYYIMLCLCVLYYKLEKKAAPRAFPLVFIAGVISQSAFLSPFATIIYTQTASEVGEALLKERGSRQWPHSLNN